MTKEQIFELWAPRGAAWSPWAKPVLFSQMDRADAAPSTPLNPEADLAWAAGLQTDAAIVVDLPGPMGVSLAPLGYRPVPLYNACPEPPGMPSMVDIRPIMNAVATAAPILEQLALHPDARPAFLLDADRNHARILRSPGAFDNRSISLPTDFPSSSLLLARGIQRILLVTANPGPPQADLSHTLRRWQDAKLKIQVKALSDPALPAPITISRPWAFGLFWYNLAATVRLMRSPLGGFGGALPMPSAG